MTASDCSHVAYQVKACGAVDKDVVVFADSKVMRDKDGLGYGEGLARHSLPLLIKLSNVYGDSQATKPRLTAETDVVWSAALRCNAPRLYMQVGDMSLQCSFVWSCRCMCMLWRIKQQ